MLSPFYYYFFYIAKHLMIQLHGFSQFSFLLLYFHSTAITTCLLLWYDYEQQQSYLHDIIKYEDVVWLYIHQTNKDVNKNLL